MQHRIITSVAVLMGALILAVIAGVVPVFPFSTEETAYAQAPPGRLNDATLSSLSLVGETLSPAAFAADTTEYMARVENSVNVVTVMAVPNNGDATYEISPRDADGSTDNHQVALQPARNTRITVTVTAEDRRTRQTYTITVYRDRSTPSDDATLSALSLVGVSLSPRFSSGTTEYDARVPYDVDEVTVAATAADIGALVPVVTSDSGDAVTNNVVGLNGTGMNRVITVTVTAENDTTMTTPPYTITVYRESGPVLDDDTTLATLSALPADIAPVAGSTTEYAGRVVSTAPLVTVVAQLAADNLGAKVGIMPTDQNSLTDGHEVYLTPGTNTAITVTVTAEDGSTNTSTITIYRDRSTPSDNANLSALSLAGVSLSPAFDPETTAYDARVDYDDATVTVEHTAMDIGARATEVAFAPGASPLSDADTTDNVYQLGMPGTVNTITVTAMAENQMTKPYIITVYRESGPVLDDDATLSSLTLTGAAALTLSPPADGNTGLEAGTTEYTVSVENPQGFVTVDAQLADDNLGAMVDIMPADQNTTAAATGNQVYLTAGVRTVITVTVTAENGSTNTYTVTVYRKRATASTDATLSALSLDGVNLSPDFDPETTAYDARVRYDVSKVTVAATVADIGAVAPIAVLDDQGAVDGNVDVEGNVVTLRGQGENTVIRLALQAESGSMNPYIITVYRENIVLSDDATLAIPTDGILGDGVTLSPDPFEVGTNEYTARTELATKDFVTVNATPAAAPAAMVDIMPADQNSLTDDHEVYLTAGAHTPITVTVTAENGSTNTYTFMVYRLRAPASMDHTLLDLSLSGAVLSPVFDPKWTDYTATASYDTEITTVTATATDIGATGPVIASPALVVPDGNQVALSAQEATTITITVTAEDGLAANADGTPRPPYMITVYRDPVPSSDATLQTLDLSGITLSPAFDPATTEYTAEVEEALATTTVEAMATHLRATVEGTGLKSLTAGVENTISVTVTAEDGTSQTYTVKVTVPSSDATLQTLDLSGITLSPAFDPATMMYTGEVGFTVRTTTVVATTTHPDATVMGTGETTLSEGDNTISVTVTAEDGTSQETYTVMVTVTAERSSVATLQALELSDIALSPAFDSTTTEYAAEVEYTVETTTVVAMPTHPGATVEGAGEMTLAEGDNTIIVTVTAEDGTSQETYTVTVTVGEAPPVEGTLLDRYDADDDNQISKDEAIAAINDYLFGEGDQQITKAQVIEVINLYLFG